MTLIEIRQHHWGWKALEATGVEPVFPKKDQAILTGAESSTGEKRSCAWRRTIEGEDYNCCRGDNEGAPANNRRIVSIHDEEHHADRGNSQDTRANRGKVNHRRLGCAT